MELPVLGIDIAKRKFDVALIVGGKTLNKACKNEPQGFTELQTWLERRGVTKVHACMEATSVYGEALATALADAGHTVSMVNPARVQGFARSELLRTKTDQVDAALIGRFCLALKPKPWKPAPREIRDLRELTQRLDTLKAMYRMEKNRLGTADLQHWSGQSIKDHLSFLKQALRSIETAIKAHFDSNPHLQQQRDLLTTIPGIAKTTASVLLAEIGDIGEFESPRQLAAYSGLAPRERTSGTSVRGRTHICKTGNVRLRSALYMPAVVAKSKNPQIKEFCERLIANGKAPKAAVVAAMRKLLHMAYGILKSGRPYDPKFGRQA